MFFPLSPCVSVSPSSPVCRCPAWARIPASGERGSSPHLPSIISSTALLGTWLLHHSSPDRSTSYSAFAPSAAHCFVSVSQLLVSSSRFKQHLSLVPRSFTRLPCHCLLTTVCHSAPCLHSHLSASLSLSSLDFSLPSPLPQP